MAIANPIDPNDVPLDALRSLKEFWPRLSPNQRRLCASYLECSDEIQAVVSTMFAIADSQNATAQERQRALSTIADALFYRPHKDKYGMDLAESERDAAKEYPLLAREVERMNSQEATFADRLRNLMAKKNITQSELAAQVDCSQSAIAHMLNRNSRPQKKTIFKLAQALKVQPTDLWPDLEVAEILDSIANFQEERELTTAEAKSLQTAMDQPPAKSRGKRLPSRKEKR